MNKKILQKIVKIKRSARMRTWGSAAIIFIFLSVMCVPQKNEVVTAAPDIANYYLAWSLGDAQITELAKWDVVILDMENQINNPEKLKKLRELNPQIIILAYITSQEIKDDALNGSGVMRKKLAEGLSPEWYVHDTKGNKMSFWPGTSLLNISDICPSSGGTTFNKYLAQFVANDILSSGLWDGVFYDNTWQDISWFSKDKADLDRNGIAEFDVDKRWLEGYKTLFYETNRLAPQALIVGNAGPGHKQYKDSLNGIMIESFPQFGWSYTMQVFSEQLTGARKPRMMIINSNTNNTGKQTDYRSMRYGLASTLLGSGYFSFDFGTQEHGQTWWYDEYNVHLGVPLTAATSIGGKQNYDEGTVWKREFSNGIALVNPTTKPQEINLGGEYEKIIGTQDKQINNGLIADKVVVGAQDGLLMMKTFQSIDTTLFKNGSFLRFFKQDGTRSRNGLFVFEEGVAAGAYLYKADFDKDGKEDRVTAIGNELSVVMGNGSSWNDKPFGEGYKGMLNFVPGHVVVGEHPYVVVAPSAGGGEIRIYSLRGEKMKIGFYPLGDKFKGGFNVAVGDIDNDGIDEIIVGVGKGKKGEVLVYKGLLEKLLARFTPYAGYTGGVGVAVGDTNGDGQKEIITASTAAKPLVRVFSLSFKRLKEFRASGVIGATKFSLTTSDVNNDGIDEIVLMND